MRWPRHRTKPDGRDEDTALRQAQEQLRDAEQELEETRERTSEIAEISRTLRRLGERNHFAPLVLEAFGGKRG